ncbi:MAG TPA: hypothetical protein VKW78_07110 [Terriglobales bacterium]|nr:hypothetical protein [Terriglobales bacterium]
MSNQSSFGAPACQYVRLTGERCTQPARRKSAFCRFHGAAMQSPEKPGRLADQLPVLEDQASIQLAINSVLRELMSRYMDTGNARLILSGLRLASANLARRRPLITASPMNPPLPPSGAEQPASQDADAALCASQEKS